MEKEDGERRGDKTHTVEDSNGGLLRRDGFDRDRCPSGKVSWYSSGRHLHREQLV